MDVKEQLESIKRNYRSFASPYRASAKSIAVVTLLIAAEHAPDDVKALAKEVATLVSNTRE